MKNLRLIGPTSFQAFLVIEGFQIGVYWAPAVRKLGYGEFNQVLPIGKTQRSP